MKYKSLATVSVLAIAALALAGCAASTPTPAESSGVKPAIRILGAGAPDYTGLTTEKWQQELKAAGYDVSLKFVDSPDDAARIVIAGGAEFFLGSPPEGIKAIQAAQAPLKALAFTEGASDFVVLGDKSLNGIADLVGKDVALNTPGATPNVILNVAAKLEGVDFTKINEITIGAGPTRLSAVQGGQVDATVVHYSEALPLVESGDFHIIADTGSILGPYLQQGLFVSTKFIDANPAATQDAIDILLDSYRWAATNKEGYMALADNYDFALSEEQRGEAWENLVANNFFPVNGEADNLDDVQAWVDRSIDAGALPDDVIPMDQWLDNSFILDYIKRNGKA